jgi:RHS repeat-associated protein
LSRLYQTAGAATTRFLYDGQEAIAEYNSSNALQRRYVFGPGLDEPIVWYEGSGTADRRWLVADERGSIVAVTDGNGAALNINSYDEYGQPASSNAGRFQFTGQMWLPEVGLYYFGARDYSASLGRFLQTDPSGQPIQNLYRYALNDPVTLIDPNGLQAQPNPGGQAQTEYYGTEGTVPTGDFSIVAGAVTNLDTGQNYYYAGVATPGAPSISDFYGVTNNFDVYHAFSITGVIGTYHVTVSTNGASATGTTISSNIEDVGGLEVTFGMSQAEIEALISYLIREGRYITDPLAHGAESVVVTAQSTAAQREFSNWFDSELERLGNSNPLIASLLATNEERLARKFDPENAARETQRTSNR